MGLVRSPIGIVINYLVSAAAPENRLSEANGTIASSIFIGLAIGPVLSGYIVSIAGAGAGLGLVAVFSLVGLVLAYRLHRVSAIHPATSKAEKFAT